MTTITPNELFLYSVILGAIAYAGIFLIVKTKSTTWPLAIGICVAIIWLFFPEPTAAVNLIDVANNVTLLMHKFAYSVGCAIGLYISHLIVDRMGDE